MQNGVLDWYSPLDQELRTMFKNCSEFNLGAPYFSYFFVALGKSVDMRISGVLAPLLIIDSIFGP